MVLYYDSGKCDIHELYHSSGERIIWKLHDEDGCSVIHGKARYDCGKRASYDIILEKKPWMVPTLYPI